MMARNSSWIVPTAAALALASAVTAATVSVSSHDAAAIGAAKTSPQLVKELNAWINSFLFSEDFSARAAVLMGPRLAHYMLTYARNFLAGSILYYLTAGIWHW